MPGLIVLLSTTTVGAKNAQNLANLFNLTGFTNQKTNEIWDTWIVGAPSFGKNVRSVLRVAVAADKNKDGTTTTPQRPSPTRTTTAASTPSTSRPTELPRISSPCRSRSATESHRRVSARARR